MNHIRSKQEFYKLSRGLLLGNRLEQWTASEFKKLFDAGSAPAIVGVRHTGGAFLGLKSYRTESSKARCWLIDNPESHTHVLFDEAAYDPWITFQGEVMPDEHHLYLRGGITQCYQREMWASGNFEHFKGLRASAILQKYMDEDSWQELNRIMKEYHYPVIEFTCFDRPVGVLRWNTLFWEIRTSY